MKSESRFTQAWADQVFEEATRAAETQGTGDRLIRLHYGTARDGRDIEGWAWLIREGVALTLGSTSELVPCRPRWVVQVIPTIIRSTPREVRYMVGRVLYRYPEGHCGPQSNTPNAPREVTP